MRLKFKKIIFLLFIGWAVVNPHGWAAETALSKSKTFLTGKEWNDWMSEREKFMALLVPTILFEEYGVRLKHSLLNYIPLINRILLYNPELGEEEVSSIFASAVYRYEPESRVALRTMEMNFLQGNFDLKPLSGPRLSLDERAMSLKEFLDETS